MSAAAGRWAAQVVACVAIGVACGWGCGDAPPRAGSEQGEGARAEVGRERAAGAGQGGRADAARPYFSDISEETGLHFFHHTGATGEYHYPECMASGCALFDYDGDGDLDVYAIQANKLEATQGWDQAWYPPPEPPPLRNHLFENRLEVRADGTRVLRFVDVTERAGVGDTHYGMGCAVGDYDNDGDLDLYLSNFGPNVLYRNNGDGTFTDVTEEAGVQDTRWGSSSAFVDYDRDGDLDLFVVNYVDFTAEGNRPCYDANSAREYCGPTSFNPVPDVLFRNNGDGTFTDVTFSSGIHRAFGSGLGVVCADFNNDGWDDIYVANDAMANQLWINQGDGTFVDEALIAGAAYNESGVPEAGMGVDAGDFDRDGDFDIFVTHLIRETNTLYLNDGTGMFTDATAGAGLATPSMAFTSFGTGFFDFDHDGWLDIYVANGAVKSIEQLLGDRYPYRHPNQLFRGLPGGRWEDVSALAGAATSLVESSRGTAFGDVDNDGDLDLLVSNAMGYLRLFRNEVGQDRGWVQLRFVGTRSNRDGIGTVVRLEVPGERPQLRRVRTDGSYCSANDVRVHFGVGDHSGPVRIVARWPSGLVEQWSDVAVNRETRLVEGSGEPTKW